MNRVSRLLLILLILIVCLGCDRATKNLAREQLATRPDISLLGGIVILEYAENSGAFLSLGANWPPATRRVVFVIMAGVALAVALVIALRSKGLGAMQAAGLALLVGGGLGNLIDRIMNEGAVIDFVSIGIGRVRTGVFNVADVAVVAGVALLALGFREQEAVIRDQGPGTA